MVQLLGHSVFTAKSRVHLWWGAKAPQVSPLGNTHTHKTEMVYFMFLKKMTYLGAHLLCMNPSWSLTS